MLALFEDELAGASVLSIGHRPGLEAFHTRTLHIRTTAEGAVRLSTRPSGRTRHATGLDWLIERLAH